MTPLITIKVNCDLTRVTHMGNILRSRRVD